MIRTNRLLAAIAALALLSTSGCDAQPFSEPEAAAEPTPSQMLAAIDTPEDKRNGIPGINHPVVRRVGAALDQLQAVCPTSDRLQLAEMVFEAQGEWHADGTKAFAADVAEGLVPTLTASMKAWPDEHTCPEFVHMIVIAARPAK